MKVQLPSLQPQLLPKDLQEHDQAKSKHTNGCLYAKADLRALRLGPRNLEIADDKATGRASKVDPRCNLSGAFRVRVQVICTYGDGRDHDAEDVEPPEKARNHVVVGLFEGKA